MKLFLNSGLKLPWLNAIRSLVMSVYLWTAPWTVPVLQVVRPRTIRHNPHLGSSLTCYPTSLCTFSPFRNLVDFGRDLLRASSPTLLPQAGSAGAHCPVGFWRPLSLTCCWAWGILTFLKILQVTLNISLQETKDYYRATLLPTLSLLS